MRGIILINPYVLFIPTLLIAYPIAAQRNLLVALDPKTVTAKSPREGSRDQETFLAELKKVEPAVMHSRQVAMGDVMTVDVVSIGSETRFDYMTSQLNTWAKSSRNFYGFSESQDYDPVCSTSMQDDATLNTYIKTCRAGNRGGPRFGGAQENGGWFCAQRRTPRALGWLQTVYGYGTPREEGAGRETVSLPDVLIVVDDDTSVDIDKVKKIISDNRGDGGPYIAAGAIFRSFSYGKFTLPHGGFGTYFNKASLKLLTLPIYCNGDVEYQEERMTREIDFIKNACTKLRENKAGENDLYSPGDSVFDVFYKLSSKPYFCMHSDWAIGYMIANYSGTKLDNVVPPRRKKCRANAVNCHNQTPRDMEKFEASHPQQQTMM